MTPPIVAIVGRPNVGKSTLFNRLVGQKLAIVHNMPGVTRDRHYADTHVHGRDLTLIDTGGFDPTTDDPMGQGIARQVQAAIDEADTVVCVLDGSMPPTSPDREAVQLLRQSGKPVVYVANKVDSPRTEIESTELYSLGIDTLYPISALHGRGTAGFEGALVDALPPFETATATVPATATATATATVPATTTEELTLTPEAESSDAPPPHVALIGRPNAGKSSLFNRLSGSERSLVDDRPGTTRDPVDSEVESAGHRFIVVDTAGIRRRSKVDRGVEMASVMRAIRAVGRAEIVVLMCDAAEGIAEQDQRLLALCTERGRAIVIGLNKMDLYRTNKERKQAEARARDALHFAPWAPIVPVSAKTGKGVRELMQTVWRAAGELKHRVPTGELNRFFEGVLDHHPPPTSGGRAPRIYYITQASTEPPVFVAMSNAPDSIKESYQRFVVNQIRKSFGFECVPIVVRYRHRSKRERR